MKYINFNETFGNEHRSVRDTTIYNRLYDVEYSVVDGDVVLRIPQQVFERLVDGLLHPIMRKHRFRDDITNSNETN